MKEQFVPELQRQREPFGCAGPSGCLGAPCCHAQMEMGMDSSVLPGGKSLMSGCWYGSVVSLSVIERHVMPPTAAHWWGCPAVWNRSWRM